MCLDEVAAFNTLLLLISIVTVKTPAYESYAFVTTDETSLHCTLASRQKKSTSNEEAKEVGGSAPSSTRQRRPRALPLASSYPPPHPDSLSTRNDAPNPLDKPPDMIKVCTYSYFFIDLVLTRKVDGIDLVNEEG
jgi:hypothetical protein